VAEHRPGMTYEHLMAAADAAVYDAKEGGRDRVAVA
jgi:PleD family two-component response regulator